MSETNKQKIDGITESTINQANGDIVITTVNGVSAVEVVQICNDVMRTQMDIYTKQATVTAQERFNYFCDNFTSRLETVESKVAEQLKEPSIQIALHESIKGSIDGNEDELTNELIDLMIERMSITDRCSEQFIIDEARRTLPKLTKVHLAFMALKVFTRLRLASNRVEFSDILFVKLNNALELISFFTKLDLNYLGQIGCVANPLLLLNDKSVEQIFLDAYDLYFRKGCPLDDFNRLNAETQLKINELCVVLGNCTIIDDCVYLNLISTKSLRPADPPFENVIPFIKRIAEICNSYTEEDVRENLIQGSNLWDSALKVLNALGKNAHLSPLGEYLGLRYLSKLLGMSIPLSLFYGESK